MRISDEFEDRANALARRAQFVIDSIDAGFNPTSEEIDKLRAALFPWQESLICGHKIIEDCECMEGGN